MMRFFYGRQITSIVNHLDGYQTKFPFLRYILNVTDDNKEIVEGEKANPHSLKDFINNYNIYYSETFKNICDYVVTLLKNNKSSLENHYEKMKIKKRIMRK